jgi:hypothetical protein
LEKAEKKLKRRLPLMKRIAMLVVLMLPTLASAANHYILPSPGTGSVSGADWSNACTGFTGNCAPGSMVRGDTYYVGGGSYPGGYIFSKADSGTSVISVLGATAANSGSVAGWKSSYDVSTNQAVFGATLQFTTDYWVLDGTAGPNFSYTTTAYGFSFGTNLSRGVTIGTSGSSSGCGSATHDITISHFYGKATSSDTEKLFEEGNTYGGVLTNVTFSHFLLDGWQGLFMTKSGNCSSAPYTGWLVEYGIMLNGFSSSANHGEWINPNERPLDGVVIRYNVFRGYSGTSGMTGTIVANNSDNTNAQIYGNVFDGLRVGNGVITGTSAGNLSNAVVYNNSFLNMTSDSGSAIGGSGQGSGNVALNNIFYNTNAQHGGGFTFDYDSYYSTTNTPSEAHGQIGSGSPFVNAAGFDYDLASDTSNWISLSSPYNLDPDGNTRTTSRGAFQFSTSSGGVTPPTGLVAIVQ